MRSGWQCNEQAAGPLGAVNQLIYCVFYRRESYVSQQTLSTFLNKRELSTIVITETASQQFISIRNSQLKLLFFAALPLPDIPFLQTQSPFTTSSRCHCILPLFRMQ